MVNPDTIPDDFPAWMRPRQRAIPWGALIAALLGMVMSWVFFTRAGIPAVTVGTHSGFIAADFAQALRDGEFVPLWLPYQQANPAPIAQFTAQGAAYLIALLDVFFTDNTAEALRLVMALSAIGAGVGIYGLTSLWGGRWGVIAAALYLLNPFVGLTVPHSLVDPSLAISHALLPLSLVLATLLIRMSSRWLVVLGAMMFGFWGLTQPALALCAWGSGLAMLALNGGKSAMPRWLGVGLCGAGLSAPLWLPALLLDNQIMWQASKQASAYVVSVWEWVTPIRTPAVTPQFTMGWLLPVLMMSTWVYRVRGGGRWPLLTVGTAVVLCAALGCLVYPAAWWLSLASVWAVAAGVGGFTFLDDALQPIGRRWASLVLIVMFGIVSFPVLIPPTRATTTDFSVSAQLRYQERTGDVAFLPAGHPVPIVRSSSDFTANRLTSPQVVAWLGLAGTVFLLVLYIRRR